MKNSHPLSDYVEDSHFARDGYNFDINSSKWKLSRNFSINWDPVCPITSELVLNSFKKVVSHYATTKSPAHTYASWARLRHYLEWANAASGSISVIKPQSLANYRASLKKRDAWYVGVIAGVIRRWHELGYPGLGEGLLPMINGWILPGNIKGEAVQLQSPTDGALTELEFEAYYSAATSAFEEGRLPLDDFALVMLLAFSGRRPIQLCDLKGKDLIIARAEDGLTEYVLNVPRAKVRDGEFRCEFKPFALSSENGVTIEALLVANGKRLANLDASGSMDSRELPLFPNWRNVAAYARMSPFERRALPCDFMHPKTDAVRTRINKISTISGAVSERTGETLNIYPTRFRRTIGTRAAREGYGPLMIAELLDHTDTQNVNVYVENVPEHVDAINEAVALQLAPLAQAFSGKLVGSEAEASRGDDPSSRIRTNGGETAGTCGHYGFCGALAPIACYTCKNFQPWLNGPHREVLNRLRAENERISRITGESPIATITNRTILAVTRVIQLCDERNLHLENLS